MHAQDMELDGMVTCVADDNGAEYDRSNMASVHRGQGYQNRFVRHS